RCSLGAGSRQSELPGFRNLPRFAGRRSRGTGLPGLTAAIMTLQFVQRTMNRLSSFVAAALIACSAPVSAQVQAVNRTANGPSATDIRVGVYANIKPDCTSGPLPSIQLMSPPENGTVTVKQGKVTATNYKQCLAVEVPAFIAFYRSRADFAGVDVLTLEVK